MNLSILMIELFRYGLIDVYYLIEGNFAPSLKVDNFFRLCYGILNRI